MPSAGELKHRVEVLELREQVPGTWEWTVAHRTWGQVTLRDKRNLFSAVGIGAREAAVVLRSQALTLHNALRWKGQHLLLTAILPLGRGYLEASAALVEAVACQARTRTNAMGQGNRPKAEEGPALSFPGVVTQKYVRYEREDTHAKAETAYVLVTPKAVSLAGGALVTVLEGPGKGVYAVEACHRLDGYQNEYEMVWKRDL